MVGSPCTIIMNQMACIMPVKRRSPTLAIWTSWFPAMGATVHFLSLSWRRTGAMPGWTPMYCSPPPRRAPWCTTPPTPSSSPDEATVSALQAAVSFQTQSDALYEIPGGLRLRVGRETLEIGNDGTVSYHTSEDAASRYPIGTTDGYTVSELVETTRRLAADTVGASCGAAQLYLMDITEGGRRHHRGLLWLQPERSGRSPSRGRLRRPVHGAERTDHRLYPALPPL